MIPLHAMNCQHFPRLLSRRVFKYSSVCIRHHNFDGEISDTIRMSLIAREDESHTYIIKYSTYGLSLSTGLSVLGSCAVFPRAVLQWNVPSPDKITPESLSLFCILQPKLDILVIGKGDWDAKVDNNIYRFMKSKNINVEILPTEQACSTFNFLNSERRVVAAGIIPPTKIRDEIDDSLSNLEFDDKTVLMDEKDEGDFSELQKEINEKGYFKVYSEHKARKKELQKLQSEKQDEAKTDDKDVPK